MNVNGKSRAALVLVASSIGLSMTIGGVTSAGANEKSDAKAADRGVPVHVQKGHERGPQQRFDLDATINKMRESAPKLSLPSNLFEPWWKTMFRDPDSDWLLSNFDIMSSDPEKKWVFPLGSGAYIPRVDIDASDEAVKVSAEVPGIDENSLDVTVTDDSVSIKGEKRAEQTQNSSKGFRSVERHYGSFERTIGLPCKVDSDKADATLKNGILTVVIPKGPEGKSAGKRLTIRRE